MKAHWSRCPCEPCRERRRAYERDRQARTTRAYKKAGRAPCGVEGCPKPLYCKGLCTMHYSRRLTKGTLGALDPLRGPSGAGSITSDGYRVLNNPAHPLARAQGKVAEHRAALYNTIGPGPHPCYWCGEPVDWDLPNGRGGLNTDHLDHDKLNNDPANLVPSCLDCNTKRRSAEWQRHSVA